MTTKVTIFNHGPDTIQIGMLQGNQERGWNASERWERPQQPGTSRDYYVHSCQRIHVEELRNMRGENIDPHETLPNPIWGKDGLGRLGEP